MQPSKTICPSDHCPRFCSPWVASHTNVAASPVRAYLHRGINCALNHSLNCSGLVFAFNGQPSEARLKGLLGPGGTSQFLPPQLPISVFLLHRYGGGLKGHRGPGPRLPRSHHPCCRPACSDEVSAGLVGIAISHNM